jgi:hypothetical protein
LFAYSAGVTSKSEKLEETKPQLIDLILVSIIWIGAVFSKIVFGWNKWLAILIWLILSLIMGILTVPFRNKYKRKTSSMQNGQEVPSKIVGRLWNSWKSFSKRTGSFQSRIFLSFFFFIIVSPIALVVKTFSDPLRIKPRDIKPGSSHWLLSKETNVNKEEYMRQF